LSLLFCRSRLMADEKTARVASAEQFENIL